MITITDTAKERIIGLLIEEKNPQLKLRTFVQGGGCAGFNYGFAFDQEVAEDDWAFPLNDEFDVVVDSMSMQYLEGATIDWKEDLMESRFVISNPNATTQCGCGSSFGV